MLECERRGDACARWRFGRSVDVLKRRASEVWEKVHEAGGKHESTYEKHEMELDTRK